MKIISLILILIIFSHIAIAEKLIPGNFTSSIILMDGRQLYNHIISNFNIYFNEFINIPDNFLELKQLFWRPKDNPRFKQIQIQFKEQVSDIIEAELKVVSLSQGSSMQITGNLSINMNLYQDPAYLELVQFMQTDLYQQWFNSRMTVPNPNPLQGMDEEFENNQAHADRTYDCSNVLPNQVENCERSHRVLLVTKNQASADKYIKIMNDQAAERGNKLRRVFDAFVNIVQRLRYPDDQQVKLMTLQTFNALCFALDDLTTSIVESEGWSNDYFFDLSEN